MFNCNSLFSEYRYLDNLLASKCCFSRGESNKIMECMSISFKSSFTAWDPKSNIEITISITSSMAFSAHFYTHPILDTHRYIDIFLYKSFFIFFPMTGIAFFGDFFSTSSTRGTLSFLFHNSKYSLHTLSNSTTSTARFTCGCFSSFSITIFTCGSFFEFNFSCISTDSVFKRYIHRYLNIFTDISSFSSSTTTKASTKKDEKMSPRSEASNPHWNHQKPHPPIPHIHSLVQNRS